MIPYIEHLADILTVGDLDVRIKAVNELMKDGKITGLEERVNRSLKDEMKLGKEVSYGEEIRSAS